MNNNLGLTKSQFEQIDKRLENITSTPVDEIELEMANPPTVEQLSDSNKSYSINCAVLFIDIRKSTDLSDGSHAKSMVKIYRSFMRMTVDCVRKNLGVTRQFLGDRIMGVFMDDKDENGNVITLGVDKAIYSARTMQTILDYSLNRHIYNNINKKKIECGIGISYGKVLVTQVGMRGTEQDEEKENEKDIVWVGKITNYASKYSDLAKGGEIFISNEVYKNLSDELRNEEVWQFVTRSKSNKVYEGYITNNFYLDNKDDFGSIFSQSVAIESNQSENYLADGILKVDNLIDKLLSKERELAKKEEELKNKGLRLQKEQFEIEKRKQEISKREDYAKIINRLAYSNLQKIFIDTFCKTEVIKKYGVDFWMKTIDDIFKVGLDLGKSKHDIKKDLCWKLTDIYMIFEMYELSYEYIVFMANFYTNISSNYNYVIPKIKKSHDLLRAIENRIPTITDEKRKEEFKVHYEKIKKISLV